MPTVVTTGQIHVVGVEVDEDTAVVEDPAVAGDAPVAEDAAVTEEE